MFVFYQIYFFHLVVNFIHFLCFIVNKVFVHLNLFLFSSLFHFLVVNIFCIPLISKFFFFSLFDNNWKYSFSFIKIKIIVVFIRPINNQKLVMLVSTEIMPHCCWVEVMWIKFHFYWYTHNLWWLKSLFRTWTDFIIYWRSAFYFNSQISLWFILNLQPIIM